MIKKALLRLQARLARLEKKLAEPLDVRTDGSIISQRVPGGVALMLPQGGAGGQGPMGDGDPSGRTRVVMAVITGGTNPYSWRSVREIGEGNFDVVTSGSGRLSGTESYNAAFERNASRDVIPGAIVALSSLGAYSADGGGGWVFDYRDRPVNAKLTEPEFAEGELDGDLDGEATTVEVLEGVVGFPGYNGFLIQVDDEIMEVVDGAGTTTWTVLRARKDTDASGHDSGAIITAVGIYDWEEVQAELETQPDGNVWSDRDGEPVLSGDYLIEPAKERTYRFDTPGDTVVQLWRKYRDLDIGMEAALSTNAGKNAGELQFGGAFNASGKFAVPFIARIQAEMVRVKNVREEGGDVIAGVDRGVFGTRRYNHISGETASGVPVLTQDANRSTTAISVSTRTPFPQTCPFMIRVEGEFMAVTEGAGTGPGDFTVTRGKFTTFAMHHEKDSRVIPVIAEWVFDQADTDAKKILFAMITASNYDSSLAGAPPEEVESGSGFETCTKVKYEWKEQEESECPAGWVDKPGGRIGLFDGTYAVEDNGNPVVPIGKVVRLTLAKDGDHYLFPFPECPPCPEGDGSDISGSQGGGGGGQEGNCCKELDWPLDLFTTPPSPQGYEWPETILGTLTRPFCECMDGEVFTLTRTATLPTTGCLPGAGSGYRVIGHSLCDGDCSITLTLGCEQNNGECDYFLEVVGETYGTTTTYWHSSSGIIESCDLETGAWSVTFFTLLGDITFVLPEPEP